MARSEPAISVLLLEERAASHVRFLAEEDGPRLEAMTTRACTSVGELRDFATETNLPNSDFVAILPRHQATLRILTLPSNEPAEIASMVALASEELAPYPREQLAIRHHVLGALPTGESRVVVVLVHLEVINQQVERLRQAGLEPGRIAFSTACLHAATTTSPQAPSGRFALAHVSSDALEVVVIDSGSLEFSRGVAHHGPWDLDSVAGREALGYEIRDALAAYRRESEEGEGLGLLYITGDRLNGEVFAALESAVGKPCQAVDFLEHTLTDSDDSVGVAVVALGAALAASGRAAMSFDFLPPTLLQHRALREFQSSLRHGGVMVALLLILLLAAFGQSVYQRMALIKELRLQAQAIAPAGEDSPSQQFGLAAVTRQVDQGGNFLALLAAVSEAAPAEGFNITRVEYDHETGMNVWGRARSKDLVLGNFLGELRQLGVGSLAQLSRAHSQYETPGQERGQSIINYHVSIPSLSEELSHDAPAPFR